MSKLPETERATLCRKLMTTIPVGHRHCSFDNFDITTEHQRRVFDRCDALTTELYRHEVQNVVLAGPVGTGKDHLAICLAKKLAWCGMSAKWLSVQSWFGELRDAMDCDTTERSMLQEYTQPDVLVLSDPAPPVGALSQHQATMLYRLVDARSSKITITTLNVASGAEADGKIGAPTWDRLCENAVVIMLAGESHRQPLEVFKS